VLRMQVPAARVMHTYHAAASGRSQVQLGWTAEHLLLFMLQLWRCAAGAVQRRRLHHEEVCGSVREGRLHGEPSSGAGRAAHSPSNVPQHVVFFLFRQTLAAVRMPAAAGPRGTISAAAGMRRSPARKRYCTADALIGGFGRVLIESQIVDSSSAYGMAEGVPLC